MSAAAAKPSAQKPLSAALLRSAAGTDEKCTAFLKSIGAGLSSMVLACLARFSPVPCQLAIESILPSHFAASGEIESSFLLECPHGNLTCRISCDRAFLAAVCDMAFGGSGADAAASFGDRPPSNIETHLCRKLISDLASGMPQLLTARTGQAFSSGRGGTALTAGAKIFRIKMLLNVFDYGGEFVFDIVESDLERLLEKLKWATLTQDQRATQKQSIAGLIAESSVEIVVKLPPQKLPLVNLTTLAPGQLLKLDAKAGGDVNAWANGQRLFIGRLGEVAGKLAVDVTGL